LQREDYPAYAAALASSIQLAISHCLLDRLDQIRCPTLLLWGGEDRVVPLCQAEAALERLPQGRLVVLPGCGHAPQLDCPEAFRRALEQFLDNVQP
jgi:pimeloyl-ACP methyl ester carboxylesterase